MSYLKSLRRLEYLLKSIIVVASIIFVFLPSFYLFSFVFLRWGEVYTEIFANPIIGNYYWLQILRYLSLSFRLALVTVAIDMLIGVPLAYLIARKEFPGKKFIEQLTALPLVIPTSGFGFATLITWTASESLPALLGLKVRIDTVVPVVEIPLLVLIVHVSLTFPYIVKTVSAALMDVQKAYEIVSASLGAKPLTTFRKITFPLITSSIFSGGVLAFARSLGETGATMIVAGVSTTASVAIVRWEFENKIAPAAFLGSLLVAIALILILPIEYMLSSRGWKSRGLRLIPQNIEDRLIRLERRVGRRLSLAKDALSIISLIVIIILPIATLAAFTVAYWEREPYTGRVKGSVLYQLFGPANYFKAIVSSTITSFISASISTFLSAYLAIFLVMFIVKSKYGNIVRALLKVPLVVPTSALGLSMILLWGPYGLNLISPSIWLIILTHIVFSVPVIVETSLASYRENNVEFYEDTARTLGANPYDVTETITLPMIKRGIIAGSMLAFTHSLGETGATFLVMGNDITVSTLVVNMVESLAIPASLFASIMLIAISFIMLVLISYLT